MFKLGLGSDPFAVDVSSLKNGGAAVNIRSPRGVIEAKRADNSSYNGPFDGQLDPGDYTVDNGTGGSDIGPLKSASR